jgi:DsbC/DsbD-like thiol-disulfide interchange protein
MPLLIMLLAWLLPAAAALGEPPALRTDNLDSRLVAAHTAVVPGEPLRIGLWLQHDPEWHTYWLNPGDSGLPTRIDLDLPPGFSAGPIQWPIPERLPAGPLVNFGYSDTLVLPLELAVPANFDAESVTLRARADWLICMVECIPGEGEYSLTLPVASDRAGRSALGRGFRPRRAPPARAGRRGRRDQLHGRDRGAAPPGGSSSRPPGRRGPSSRPPRRSSPTRRRRAGSRRPTARRWCCRRATTSWARPSASSSCSRGAIPG